MDKNSSINVAWEVVKAFEPTPQYRVTIHVADKPTYFKVHVTGRAFFVSITFQKGNNDISLTDLDVYEENRKSGIGTKVILSVAQVALALGYKSIKLETDCTAKPYVIQWYKKIGFIETYFDKSTNKHLLTGHPETIIKNIKL